MFEHINTPVTCKCLHNIVLNFLYYCYSNSRFLDKILSKMKIFRNSAPITCFCTPVAYTGLPAAAVYAGLQLVEYPAIVTVLYLFSWYRLPEHLTSEKPANCAAVTRVAAACI